MITDKTNDAIISIDQLISAAESMNNMHDLLTLLYRNAPNTQTAIDLLWILHGRSILDTLIAEDPAFHLRQLEYYFRNDNAQARLAKLFETLKTDISDESSIENESINTSHEKATASTQTTEMNIVSTSDYSTQTTTLENTTSVATNAEIPPTDIPPRTESTTAPSTLNTSVSVAEKGPSAMDETLESEIQNTLTTTSTLSSDTLLRLAPHMTREQKWACAWKLMKSKLVKGTLKTNEQYKDLLCYTTSPNDIKTITSQILGNNFSDIDFSKLNQASTYCYALCLTPELLKQIPPHQQMQFILSGNVAGWLIGHGAYLRNIVPSNQLAYHQNLINSLSFYALYVLNRVLKKCSTNAGFLEYTKKYEENPKHYFIDAAWGSVYHTVYYFGLDNSKLYYDYERKYYKVDINSDLANLRIVQVHIPNSGLECYFHAGSNHYNQASYQTKVSDIPSIAERLPTTPGYLTQRPLLDDIMRRCGYITYWLSEHMSNINNIVQLRLQAYLAHYTQNQSLGFLLVKKSMEKGNPITFDIAAEALHQKCDGKITDNTSVMREAEKIISQLGDKPESAIQNSTAQTCAALLNNLMTIYNKLKDSYADKKSTRSIFNKEKSKLEVLFDAMLSIKNLWVNHDVEKEVALFNALGCFALENTPQASAPPLIPTATPITDCPATMYSTGLIEEGINLKQDFSSKKG